ncbi:MAG: hypothetical protein FIA95_01175 [Gemmatimonadetes bacterium]|nr:hypothetical protein [Gemmatimonadota bacterium]
MAARYADAIRLFRDAFARDPTWLFAAAYLQVAYTNLSRWQEADSVLVFLEARRERLTPVEALFVDMERAWQGSPEGELRATLAFAAVEPVVAYQATSALIRVRRPVEALKYYALRDTTTTFGRDWQLWDTQAGSAYHVLGRFEEELALARAAKAREPRYYNHWVRETSALAALGRTDEIDRIVTESYGLETQGAPARLMNTAATELSLHGRTEAARGYAERTLAGLDQWPDSIQATSGAKEIRRNALRILGRHEEVVRIYEEQSRAASPGGLQYRSLGMRSRILMGDTVGALALVDSARTHPLTTFVGWTRKGTPLYYGAHILSLLGRRDEAVASLREALNQGHRLGSDEPLQWYWAPIKDYPPFQELVKLKDGS